MCKELADSFTAKIVELQDENGCWNVLHEGDRNYPQFNYYIPNYKSTLWTMILLADIQCDPKIERLKQPLESISNQFLNNDLNIYSIGKSHFPIPCLNGNMIYLHSFFQIERDNIVDSIIDFFAQYQRFDDGNYKTPSDFPYYSNRSCYGKHTCYWGVVKLLKGLSFIPKNKRSSAAEMLIKNCIDYILLHNVCFSSHDNSKFLQSYISKLTFPNMYKADYLEILWLLKREQVKSDQIDKALCLLKSKMKSDSTWKIERLIKDLIIPVNNRNHGNKFLTRRALEVIDYYGG